MTVRTQDGAHISAWRNVAVCLGLGAALTAYPALAASAHTSKTAKATKSQESLDSAAADPLTLVVSLSEQRVDIFRGDTQVLSSRVSTGQKGYETPSGIFSILQKKKWHRSNIYSAAPMPYMQRLTWSGIALHAGVVPNRPASHGCIRLPSDFATKLFRTTGVGAHVVIVRDKAAPVPFDHPALFQPFAAATPEMAMASVVQVANAAQSDAGAPAAADSAVPISAPSEQTDPGWYGHYERGSASPLRILITRRTGREQLMDVQSLLKELHYPVGEIDGYMGPATAGAIRAFQENHYMKVDGMVSHELLQALSTVAGRGEVFDGHIYVRQDFKRLFDAPIRLRDPEAPLGTHLYTVRHFVPGDGKAEWLALTPETHSPTTAAEALERVEIPSFIRRMISAKLTPGSSLIISDDGLSKETFPKGTDFVVLTQ